LRRWELFLALWMLIKSSWHVKPPSSILSMRACEPAGVVGDHP
jgi:hypothetical protein